MKINSFKWQNCWWLLKYIIHLIWQTLLDFRIRSNLGRIIQIILSRAKITQILTSLTIHQISVTIKCWLFKIHLTIILLLPVVGHQTSWPLRAITSLNHILDWWAGVRANLYKAHVEMILQWVLMLRTGMRKQMALRCRMIIQSRWLQQIKFRPMTWINCPDILAKSHNILRAITLSSTSTKR